MTFLRRMFGGRSQDGYARAIALVEDGRLAEALPILREVYAADRASPQGSVTGYYLRQALVGEGRRLLENGDHAEAARTLTEATGHWPDYPDLQFLAGAAACGTGDWDTALGHARAALQRNPDYCEARLLEAAALQGLGRDAEAAGSLDKLLESGRRVDHELVREFARDDPHAVGDLPDDLTARVRRVAVGDDAKRRLNEAVAQCRAGRWDEGLAAFTELVDRYPRYPDIRAKHAAALYQVGRLDLAQREVEAALAINDRYRSAVSLHGLILAERGRLREAAHALEVAVPRFEGTIGRHEELFLAYLRATLALLLGERGVCRELLSGWNDLGRQFARAELLLVACDDLDGWHDAAQRRLDTLLEIWTADAEMTFLRAVMLLAAGQWAAVEAAITHWPGGAGNGDDARPLLLQARLDVSRGREPTLPADWSEAVGVSGPGEVPAGTWRQIAVHGLLLGGHYQAAWDEIQALVADEEGDEETGRLWLRAAAARIAGEPELLAHPRLEAPRAVPDAWVPELCCTLRRGGAADRAEALVRSRARVRPDVVTWSWLSAGFWLAPVRRWIA
ncbi:tetratricopeptide repeat protein [bacterium]|nr:tetratricopeptide repeat protein [bacterium]